MATLLDLGGEVDRILGNRENDAVFALSKAWVSRAHQALTLSRQIPERKGVTTIPTVTTQWSYGLPADFFAIRVVRNNTLEDGRLTQLGDQRFFNLDRGESGSPEYYIIEDGNLLVWKVPDAVETLEVRYWKRLNNMGVVGDAATTELGEEWDTPIILKAVSYGLKDRDDAEKADQYDRWAEREADRLLPKLGQDIEDRDEPVQVIGLYS